MSPDDETPDDKTWINQPDSDEPMEGVSPGGRPGVRKLDAKSAPSPVRTPTAEYDNIPRTPLKDKYEFLTVLGSGGAGVIYKARQQPLGRLVAVKMIHSHLVTPTAVKRFQQEATTIARISHANIISVYDFGISEENQPFMVMDYVEGSSLSDILDKAGTLSVEMTKSITKQLCDGLAHAHSRGILHRDLKPNNIMMVPVENGPDVAKILDFGLAKIMYGEDESGAHEHLTKTGETVGTPAFMSPEQVMGKGLDHRTDLYSLGCMMYHCLTGEPPFVGDTKMETMLMHLNSKPEPINPSEGEPLVSPYLEIIILKLLEKNPDDRFQSMTEVKEAIEAVDKGLFVTPVKVDTPQSGEEEESSSTAATRVPPGPEIGPAGEVVNQLLTYRALLVMLIAISFLSMPLLIAYIWINAYPTRSRKSPRTSTPSKVEKRVKEDPYKEDRFFDDAFAKNVERDSHSVSAHHDPDITDNALKVLEGHKNVRIVDLSGAHRLTEKAMAHMKGVGVVKLNLRKSRVKDGLAEYLPTMTDKTGRPSLEELNLSETGVTDKLLPALRSLPALQVVDLSVNRNITSEGARAFANSKLRRLNLSKTLVGDAAMDSIGTATDLIWLDLSGTKITDAGVQKLAKLTQLQELSLAGTQITDEAVKVLANFPKLTVLNISRTFITDRCFPAILKRDGISYINISGCDKITPLEGNNFRHKMALDGRTVERNETAGRE